MVRLYTLLRAISMDVVAGALICNLFLAYILQVKLPLSALSALGLTVWIIYTTDHLWDAHRIVGEAKTHRHRFHQKNFKSLRIAAVVCLLFLAVNCFFLPLEIIRGGLVVGALVIIYFVLVRTAKVIFFKELFIAAIYSLGIFLAPVALANTVYGYIPWLYLQFALLAAINLLEFSYFEMAHDQQHQFQSAALRMGARKTFVVIKACLTMVVLLVALGVIIWTRHDIFVAAQGVLLFMTLLLALIVVMPNYFKQYERFRILGDAVFLVPLILLL